MYRKCRPVELFGFQSHILRLPMFDMYPMSHYSNYVGGIIQQQVYQTKVQHVNDLKQHLIDVWAELEDSIIMPPPP